MQPSSFDEYLNLCFNVYASTERNKLGFFMGLPIPARVPPFGKFTHEIRWSLRTRIEFFHFYLMTLFRLPNYLLSNRKRLSLSQEEVAFLLGTKSGQQVCRHERFAREPSLETAFAYEAIYKRTASELFSGFYQKVEQEVAARAKLLSEQTNRGKSDGLNINKRQFLSDLAAMQLDNPDLE